MVKIVGVRFRNAGKVYYFDPKDYKIKPGDHVIVETARGIEYGTVTGKVQEIAEEKVIQPLKSVIRVSNAEDDARATRNCEKEREAMSICKEKIRKHDLDMKLIDAEYTFDNNKVLFYFTADGRIDFRELVKDLAAVFRTRIELRQIGVRDETKILGGVGICGRQLCCNTFLSEFAPVSIKMAKEQNLSLNPTKISGVCGRLMCCLKNEEETYEYLNSKLPSVGDTVTTSTGLQGEVSSVNVLRQKVKVLISIDDEKELQEYDVNDLKFKPRRKKEKGNNGDKADKKDRSEREKTDRDRNDRDRGEKSERDRSERGEKDKSDKARNDRERGEKDKSDRRSDREHGEKDKSDSRNDRERGEKDKSERSRTDRERGEKDKSERSRTDREHGKKERSDRRNNRENGEKDKSDSRSDRERGEKERSEGIRSDRERGEKERSERIRTDCERGEKERSEGIRTDRERGEKERSERIRTDCERGEKEKSDETRNDRNDRDGLSQERGDRDESGQDKFDKNSVEWELSQLETLEQEEEKSRLEDN